MGYTKRQFVEAALVELAIAGEFDIDPESLQSALRSLDAMLATWNANGIKINYLMPSTPEDSELQVESGVPDSANEAIIKNLAIRIAPSYGKVVMPETRVAAKRSYSALLGTLCHPPEMQPPSTLPKGAGYKHRHSVGKFFPAPTEPILTDLNGEPILSK